MSGVISTLLIHRIDFGGEVYESSISKRIEMNLIEIYVFGCWHIVSHVNKALLVLKFKL